MQRHPERETFIYTEAGARFGFGHLARCQALAQALEAHGIPTHFVVDADASAIPLLANTSHSLANWKQPGWQPAARGAITVADSYTAPLAAYETLAAHSLACCWVDDENRLAYPPGIVLHAEFGAEDVDFARPPAQLLLGPRYALLRSPFWQPSSRLVSECVARVAITFGGMPNPELYRQAIRAVKALLPQAEIRVLLGATPPEAVGAGALAAATLLAPLSADAMAALFRWADVAITAGGGTLLELAACQTPAVVVPTAPNQLANTLAEHALGAILNAGPPNQPGFAQHLQACLALVLPQQARMAMAEASRSVCDGQGARRVAQALLAQLPTR